MNKKSENILKNSCIELLNSFSEKEINGLRHLVTCTYFNTDKTIVKLLDIIIINYLIKKIQKRH